MAITLVNKITLTPPGNSGGTTGAIDARGANCFVGIASSYIPNAAPDISDSLNGGVFTRVVDKTDGSACRISIYTRFNPTVGASQTFTLAPSFGIPYCTMTVLCFSGVDTVFGVDQVSAGGSSIGSTTVQPGSITPGLNGSVVIAALGIDNGTAPPTIDSSFTVEGNVAWNSGTYFGHGAADLIQGTAGAVNPTFTYGGSPTRLCAVQLSLRPAAVSTMAVAVTEGADSVSATVFGNASVSAAITESPDSVSATLNSTFNTAIAITESPDIVDIQMLAEALLAIAVTESPDAVFAHLGYDINIAIAATESPDVVSISLANDGSWSNCTPVDTAWTECNQRSTTWTECPPATTDWTEEN